MRDGNGKLLTISFQDDTSNEEVTQEEIDEMLFILDTLNIPVKGYHEMTHCNDFLHFPDLVIWNKENLN